MTPPPPPTEKYEIKNIEAPPRSLWCRNSSDAHVENECKIHNPQYPVSPLLPPPELFVYDPKDPHPFSRLPFTLSQMEQFNLEVMSWYADMLWMTETESRQALALGYQRLTISMGEDT